MNIKMKEGNKKGNLQTHYNNRELKFKNVKYSKMPLQLIYRIPKNLYISYKEHTSKTDSSK
jgi:hypothetical protein